MTDEVLNSLRQAFLIGATNAQAANLAGITEKTLYNYIDKHPEFLQQMEGWKADPILKAKKTIVDSLDEVKNAQWYLERKAKKEYGANVDVTSDGDKLQPILVKFIGEEDAKDN